jgi:hypothetical protein
MRVSQALRSTFGPRGVVRVGERIDQEDVDLVVRANDPAGNVLLALDVTDRTMAARSAAHVARLAAANVPELWQIELQPNRDPLTSEMVLVWRQPDAKAGRYRSMRGMGGDPDLSLRPAALPDVRVPITAVLPPPCAPAPTRETAANEHAVAPVAGGVPACRDIVFELDGSAPPPSLTFEGFDEDGVATRFRFTGASTVPSGSFDPASAGLTVAIRGPFWGNEVVEATVPMGSHWRRAAGAQSSWTYADPRGAAAGITNVTVQLVGAERLAWEIRAQGGRFRVPPGEIQEWGSLGVHLGSVANAGGAPCGHVFFPTAIGGTGCREDRPGSLTCLGPARAPSCAGSDPDALVRCALQRTAHAEDVFFAWHGRYLSGDCASVLDLELPEYVTCTVAIKDRGFSAVASHAEASYAKGCRWESGPPSGTTSMTCS